MRALDVKSLICYRMNRGRLQNVEFLISNLKNLYIDVKHDNIVS